MNGYHPLRTILLTAMIASPAISGCYTQLATDGDYWGYSGQRVHRQVIIHKQTPVAPDTTYAQANPADSVKVDTVFIDDNRARNDQGYADGTTTIINNYYGPGAYQRWYDYYPSRPGFSFSVSFGSPWYYGYGYYPYDNWYHVRHRWAGVYEYEPYYPYPPSPFYGCLAPVYDPFYYPYYDPFWGRRGFRGDDDDRNRIVDRNPNHRIGRIDAGETRGRSSTQVASSGSGTRAAPANGNTAGASPGGRSGNPATRASAPASGRSNIVTYSDNLSRVTSPSQVQSNAPSASVNSNTQGQSASTQGSQVVNAPSQVTSAPSQMTSAPSQVASASSRIVSSGGHRVVYIHRSSPNAVNQSVLQQSRGSSGNAQRVDRPATVVERSSNSRTSSQDDSRSSYNGSESQRAQGQSSPPVQSSGGHSEGGGYSSGRSSSDGGSRASAPSGDGGRSSGGRASGR